MKNFSNYLGIQEIKHFYATPGSFYRMLTDKTKFKIGTPYFALVKK